MKPREGKIEVTQRDIDRGIVEDCRSCPIALATRRTRIMPVHKVSVGAGSLDVEAKWRYPEKVATFIDAFDGGESVKPFSFVVTKPN